MSDEKKSCSASPNAEPAAERSHLPMWILALTFVLLYLGAVFFDHHGGWFDREVYSPYASAEELDAWQPKFGAAALLAQGRVLYEKNCGICHGNDGLGKPGQFPPLAGSEWVNAKGVRRLEQIPLQGLNGPIEVKGQALNFPSGMVAIGTAMADADLAAVLTYIRSAWGNQAGEVMADDVKAARAAAGAHPQPLSGDQLAKMPE
jgi:mono/diheme cytochrome c family protein